MIRKISITIAITLLLYSLLSAQILLVDDDGSVYAPGEFTDASPYFKAALDSIGVYYKYYEILEGQANGPSAEYMANFDVVIWFTGECWVNSQTLTDIDELALGTYLDNGGKLFLSAMDYLDDRYHNAGAFNPGDFPYDHLGVASTVQDNWYDAAGYPGTVQGVATFNSSMLFDLNDIYTGKEGLFIDELVPIDTVGIGFFNMVTSSSQGICAVYTENTIFTTADFAALVDGDSLSTKQLLMEKILNYFDYLTPVENNTQLIPSSVRIYPNYPNPFNPQTSFKFSLPYPGRFDIGIYNILGEKVANLGNSFGTGIHTLQRNGKNENNRLVGSGVYFTVYKMDNKIVQTRKILLMK